MADIISPADIEGVWTYFYYSYSATELKAVGIVKFGESEPKIEI